MNSYVWTGTKATERKCQLFSACSNEVWDKSIDESHHCEKWNEWSRGKGNIRCFPHGLIRCVIKALNGLLPDCTPKNFVDNADSNVTSVSEPEETNS